MANFAVAASAETIERGNRLIEMYKQDGDKSKEETLKRIFDLAESESVRGTHPELEGPLKAADSTIATLIKQINGIVAGQDKQLEECKAKVDKAIADKNTALEEAKADKEAAAEREKAADEAIKKAEADIQMAETKAQGEIEKANNERDQALRERDDARTIADEKTASNDLLMRQMASMEESVEEFKTLQKAHSDLQADYASLQETSKEAARKAAEDLREAQRETALLTEEKERVTNSLEELRSEKNALADRNQINDLNQQLIKAAGDAELATERAVMAKEREMQTELRAADRENAKLQARIEQLEAQLAEAQAKKEKDRK